MRRMRQDPRLSTGTRQVLDMLVMDPQQRRANTYVLPLDVTMERTGMSRSAVQRAYRQAVAEGWLVRCGGVSRNHPQRWHRSLPWDPCHLWANYERCEVCGLSGVPSERQRQQAGKGVTVTPVVTPVVTPIRARSCTFSRYESDALIDLTLQRMLSMEVLADVA